MLASLAGKLLEESESSSTSTYGDSQEDHLVVKIKQEHELVYNDKPCKSELSHQGNLSSKSPSDNTSETCLQVSSLENDCVLEQTPVSDCKIALGLKQPLLGCGNKKEDCAVLVEQGEATNGLMIPDTISLKDLSHEPVHMPPGGYMNHSKLVCRDDDDEKYCKSYKFSDKCNKSYRPMTRVGHRRIKKSKYGRAFPRSKCFEDNRTGW